MLLACKLITNWGSLRVKTVLQNGEDRTLETPRAAIVYLRNSYLLLPFHDDIQYIDYMKTRCPSASRFPLKFNQNSTEDVSASFHIDTLQRGK